ncbi:MAG: TonB family protein [Puniceicoccaceae bacterium]|nr:MAG: TonB family protein [Puniceicoccaceae bacterium]
MPSTSVDTPPLFRFRPRLKLGPEQRAAIGKGKVSLSVVISDDGLVEDVQVIESTHADLERAAVELYKRAIYWPGKHRGRAVWVRMTVPIQVGNDL